MIQATDKASTSPKVQKKLSHFLTFDVEEYFQVEAASARLARSVWKDMPCRLHRVIDRILEILDDFDTRATFFILGWVAENEPEIVRKIAAEGHEIASHGMEHRMLTRLSRQKFYQSICDSKALLEDLSSQKVFGFRAPTFSLLHSTAWAIDELLAAGYAYDSSVFPVRHDRYGVPHAPRHLHYATGPSGQSIIEIPPLTFRALRNNWPIGGGGYFRLAPLWMTSHAIDLWQKQGTNAMIYLHPWEFDPDQPVLPMSRISRWRHRVNLSHTERKLRSLLMHFDFCSVRQRLDDLRQKVTLQYTYGETSCASA